MPVVTLKIDGRAFPSGAAAGHEAVGEHFRIQVQTRGNDDGASALVGKDFELTIATRQGASLVIKGIVAGVSSTYARGEQLLVLDLGPEAEILRHGQGSHVYLGKTSVDIVKAVIARAGAGAARWTTTGTFLERAYTAQYREDDWSFIERVSREDGLWFFHDHDGGTALVFADSSEGAACVGTFLHRTEHGTTSDQKWVSGLAARTIAVSNGFVTRDRDPLKPKVDLSAQVVEGDGKLAVYAWPGRVETARAATVRAKTSLEALRSRRLVVTGVSESPAIRCGKVFTIGDGPLPETLRELFCVAVDWTIDERGTFRLQFSAVPKAVPFRLPLRVGARQVLGPETAFVRGAEGQEIDADEHGRVFVQPIWDRDGRPDDSCSIRARVGQAGVARSMAIPRLGWGMLIGHENDDVDRPWVMARLVDGTHPPPHQLPHNKTRTSWHTLTSPGDGTFSEVVFEDKLEAEQLSLVAARDMAVRVGDNEARTIGNRHVLEIGADRTVTVEADDKLTVTTDQATFVKGDEAIAFDGSRSITVKGDEEDSVGGTRTEKVKVDRTTDVGKKRTLTVAGAMSVRSKAALTREVLRKHSLTSAAAWTIDADGGLVTTTKGDSTETVATARTLNGKAGIDLLVKGDLKDTIAAAHAVTAKGSVGESAKGKMTLSVGAALTATAPEIELVAESEISIVCGGATISIKGGEVTVSAPTLAVAGPVVSSSGAQVKHNP